MATNRRSRPPVAVAPAASVSTAPRPDRIRCASCGMPVRGSADECWSCGRDPQVEGDADMAAPSLVDESAAPVLRSAPPPPRGAVRAVQVLGLLALVGLVAGALLVLPRGGDGVQQLADRVGRGVWERVETPTFAVDLPGRAVTAPTRLEGVTDAAVTSAQAEEVSALVVHGRIPPAVDAGREMAAIMDRYAPDTRSAQRRPVTDEGAPALDCTVAREDGVHRLRVLPLGSQVFLFDVASRDPATADAAFARVVDGFEVTAP